MSETSIKVGHIGILTGPVSSVGDDISWAGQAVLQATNDAGGINGRKLEVLVRDDAWDGTKGMNAARDLVNREKIFAFCCTMTVATTDLLAVYTDEVKVPNVGSDGWGDDQYDRAWSWPAGNSSINDGYALAEYAIKEQGAKTIALLYFDGTFGRDFRDGYKFYAEKLGAKVVVEQAGSFDDPGTATFIAKARAANVDLLTFNGEPGLWVKMVREAASQGYKPKLGFQGTTGIYFNEIPGLAGPHAEGSHSTTHWTPNDVGEAQGDSNPAYANYSKLITKYYPKIQHGNWTKVGYSGALHWVDIVKRMGSNVTRQGMKEIADNYGEWDVGLGTKVTFWCNHRGNHNVNILKLVKDPEAANSPDPRTRDAVRLGNGMRFKYAAGPFADPVNRPDGSSDNPAINKPCAAKG